MERPVPLTIEFTSDLVTSVLKAPTHWREIDFISDLHLQVDDPATFAAWQTYMQTTPADAVFILGDLFEVWVGDDVMDHPSTDLHQADTARASLEPSFEKRCVDVLKATSQRLSIFILHGNRDFLLSTAFETESGSRLLNDPTRLEFADQVWLLSHGDSLCLADTDYLSFKAQVRSTSWKQTFLAKPIQERLSLARSIRQQSELRKKTGLGYADVDGAEAIKWLETHQASTLVHGHTHKPDDHWLEKKCLSSDRSQVFQRIVLSDWDALATPPRTEVLRLGVGYPPRRVKV